MIALEPSYEDWWMRSIERYGSSCLAIPDVLDAKDTAYIDGLIADHRHTLSVPFQPATRESSESRAGIKNALITPIATP